MIAEPFFRLSFWTLFVALLILQLYFAAGQRHRPATAGEDDRAAWRREPLFAVVRVLRAASMVAFLLLYAFNAPWLEPLALALPAWLRMLGIALGLASLALYAWSRATLGRQWSSQLRVRQEHQLVTTGPYAHIRHPIYAALDLFLTSIALVTAHAFLFAFLAVSVLDHALRIPREEQLMIERFGEEYREYTERAGRLFPR